MHLLSYWRCLVYNLLKNLFQIGNGTSFQQEATSQRKVYVRMCMDIYMCIVWIFTCLLAKLITIFLNTLIAATTTTRKSTRRRKPSRKSKNNATTTDTPRNERKRKPKRRRQHNTPHTPQVTAKNKRNKLTPAIVAATTTTTSVSPPVIADHSTMHMCECGLLHEDLDAITTHHNAHCSSCTFYNEEPPPFAMPAFQPMAMNNIRLARRRKKNTEHLEFSAFIWVSRWLDKNGSWPTTPYSWVHVLV